MAWASFCLPLYSIQIEYRSIRNNARAQYTSGLMIEES